MQKFKESVKNINAADMSLAVKMSGTDSTDKVSLNMKLDAKVDYNDKTKGATDFNIEASGNMKASGKLLSGDIGLNLRTIGKELYFNLTKFSSSDPSAKSIQTVLQPYEKKWQHLASDFIPQSVQTMLNKDEDTLKKEKQLKELFVNTNIFDITKEYGVEKLNGNKVYHYGISFNKNGLKEYIKKASKINGREMTSVEVDNAVKFADSISKMELWIGAKDYYLYKGTVDFSAKDTTKSTTSDISVTYTAKSYNKNLKITAPSDYKEFNPLALLMGMQAGSALDSSSTATSSSSSSGTTGSGTSTSSSTSSSGAATKSSTK